MAELLSINPATLNLACAFRQPLTEAQVRRYTATPPCPTCRRRVKVTWRKVSLPGEPGRYLPGEWACPAGCPKPPRQPPAHRTYRSWPPWQRRGR